MAPCETEVVALVLLSTMPRLASPPPFLVLDYLLLHTSPLLNLLEMVYPGLYYYFCYYYYHYYHYYHYYSGAGPMKLIKLLEDWMQPICLSLLCLYR